MFEMMIDLETLDTRPKAIVLSVGAVVWETLVNGAGELEYQFMERVLNRPEIDMQVAAGRTVSQSTLVWWQSKEVSAEARAEAFHGRDRCATSMICANLDAMACKYGVNHFWASPNTFDFPIMESLAEDFSVMGMLPWSYRQTYDVRTVVNEASYSARDHKAEGLVGAPHTPVYDCEWQIDLLTAARNKINRRIGT